MGGTGGRDLPHHRTGRAFLIGICLAAALGGCSSSDSIFSFSKPPEPKPLDPKEFPSNYKTEIATFMRTYLENPRNVRDAYVGQPVLKPVNGQPQYITCVRYNPRNRQGQYQGTKTSLAIFLGGQITQFLDGKPEMCGDLNYQRFPEIEAMVP